MGGMNRGSRKKLFRPLYEDYRYRRWLTFSARSGSEINACGRRQDVGQKAAGEERRGDGFGLLDVVFAPVAPGVGDLALAKGLDTAVPDRDFVRVTGDVVDRLARIVRRGFGEDDPALVLQRGVPRLPDGFVGQGRGPAAARF